MAELFVATWNLNHRAGSGRFHPEAANVAISLGADLLVFTEYFPREYENQFRSALSNAGWTEQLISEQSSEVANRVLIASKLPLKPMPLDLPMFDQQFPSNILGVRLPSLGLSILGVRVPAYSSKTKTGHLLFPAWDWLETTAASLRNGPAVIIGDLNIQTSSGASRAGNHLRRILANGWHRAEPGEPTFFGHNGKTSEIDHILATDHCTFSDARVYKQTLSDHAALMCRIEFSN